MSKQTDFIEKYSDSVVRATAGTKLFPSVKMAQMIIESGYGKSANATKGNNFFGIKKGYNWSGETIILNTPRDAVKKSEFRKYKNAEESIKDHSNFLIKNKRYTTAGVFNARTPEEQIKAIAKGGYAESKNYANTIIKLINQYNLKKLDRAEIISAGIGIKPIIGVLLLIVAYNIYKG
jgi:flagellum-specific peptidoglycan hydrolase FlgJ